MKHKKQPDSQESPWKSTQYSNLIRYVPSGTYYARFRVKGKLVWKSLKTDKVSVAQLRLADMEKKERAKAEKGELLAKGKVLFEHALKAYRDNGFRPATPRTPKDKKPLKPAAVAYYEQRVTALLKSWPGLSELEVRRITEADCKRWGDEARLAMSASAFNHTLGALRNILEFGIKVGARYDNPAAAVIRESELPKKLQLPSGEQFEKFLEEMENAGGGFSRACANLVRFMAYGGLRKGEAENVMWSDCDFERGRITLNGHPDTGLKNRRPGETRTIPMIPEMRKLLEQLRSKKSNPSGRVMKVKECQKAMDRAAKVVGMHRITHHDLRHLFATRCIESGVDIPTVARWLGHKDGGATAMKTYGHLRDHHSASMAQKVSFSPKS